MNPHYRRPDLEKQAFARTNHQTIEQRATILRELLPNVAAIADVCCGDCTRQHEIYHKSLKLKQYCGLDITPEIAAANREKGIACICGDALDKAVLSQFLGFDVIFFGPPLSVDCDGHTLLTFHQITPSYADFLELLCAELGYAGTVVCICPKGTTLGDARLLYERIRSSRNDVGLRLIHHSITSVTGDGERTEPRLKYVELWFSSQLPDQWEVRESWG